MTAASKRYAAWTFLLGLWAAWPLLAVAQTRAGEIVTEHGQVRDEQGRAVAYEIGTLWVPENRHKPGSRLIGVGFARIRAMQASDAPPIFWLPGGPGLSVLDAFADNNPGRLRTWLNLASVADLVIVEQRGYTLRGDKLMQRTGAFPLDQPASLARAEEEMRERARAAIIAHPDHDLAGYDIAAFADDVDDLRKALGYGQISLFGGSFGSQWSLAVMRLHPEIVARAVLSGVEPLDNGYDMPSQVMAALQRIAFDADRDMDLKIYLPRGGLMEAIRALRARFAAGPIQVRVADEAGQARVVTLGAEDLQQALLSHTQEGQTWPAFIISLYHQRYEDWAREVMADRAAGESILIGPLVDSSLGVSAACEHRLRTDPAVDWLGAWNFATNIASAADWPTADMGDALRVPVPNDTPVLFVHGDWDTSTPLDNTLGLLPYFRNGHAIVVHRGGHDGAMYLLRDEPKAKAAVLEFLRSGQTRDLPVTVELPLPKFEMPAFVPPAAAP